MARAEVRMFRFSRLGPQGELTDPALNQVLAKAMTTPPQQPNADGADPNPRGVVLIDQM